jgi:hypothetical protein
MGRRQEELVRLKKEAAQLLTRLQKLLADDVNVTVAVKHNEPFTVAPAEQGRRAARPAPAGVPEFQAGTVADPAGREQLDGPRRKIIDAYAWWHSIGVAAPTRHNVAPLAGYSNVASKGFVNPLSACRTSGLVEGDSLTELGRELAAWPEKTDEISGYHDKLKGVMDGPTRRVFEALVATDGEATREALARAAGYENVASKGFVNPLSRLSSMGLIVSKAGQVKGTELMYPPGLAGEGK